jgi:polygalacturonase
MPIFFSDRVAVSNLKILGYRANSDGIDIYSSRDVSVEGCFIRTVDDVITVKSKTQTPNVVAPTDVVSNVNVTGNRLWNETGTAMVIGTAVGTNISGVTFSNNDVIHDLARGASEGINLAGAGTVSNIRFENNRIDRSSNQIDAGGASRVIYVYIQHSQWEATADKNKPLGKVRDVTFANTTVLLPPQSPKMRIDLQGASDQSDIEGVQFQNVTVNGKPLSKSNTVVNEKFASKISGLP